MTPREEGVRRAARELRGLPVEHLVAINENGEEVYRMSGDSHSVGVPVEVAVTWRTMDLSVVHNHPVEAPLSPSDLLASSFSNDHEVIAVTPSGVMHRCKRPANGWIPTQLIPVVMGSPYYLVAELCGDVVGGMAAIEMYWSGCFTFVSDQL